MPYRRSKLQTAPGAFRISLVQGAARHLHSQQGTAVSRNGCEATAGLSNRRGAYKAPFLGRNRLLVLANGIAAEGGL